MIYILNLYSAVCWLEEKNKINDLFRDKLYKKDLSQNDKFYSDINKYLTSIFDMRKAIPKDSRDRYYQTIMQPISEKMIDLVYDKVCAEIVIPKLKTLSKDEQRKIFARHIRLS